MRAHETSRSRQDVHDPLDGAIDSLVGSVDAHQEVDQLPDTELVQLVAEVGHVAAGTRDALAHLLAGRSSAMICRHRSTHSSQM